MEPRPDDVLQTADVSRVRCTPENSLVAERAVMSGRPCFSDARRCRHDVLVRQRQKRMHGVDLLDLLVARAAEVKLRARHACRQLSYADCSNTHT